MLSDAPLHLLSSAKHVAHGRGRQRRTALATSCEAFAILRAFFLGAFRVAHHALHNVGAAPGAVAHVRAVKHLHGGVWAAWVLVVSVCDYKGAQAQGSRGQRKQEVRKGTYGRRTWFSHASHDSMPSADSVASAALPRRHEKEGEAHEINGTHNKAGGSVRQD